MAEKTAERAVRGGGQSTELTHRRGENPVERQEQPCNVHYLSSDRDIERSGTNRRQLAKATEGESHTRWRCTMSKRIFVALASMAALVLSAGAGFSWS